MPLRRVPLGTIPDNYEPEILRRKRVLEENTRKFDDKAGYGWSPEELQMYRDLQGDPRGPNEIQPKRGDVQQASYSRERGRQASAIMPLITKAAEKYGLSPKMFARLVANESGFDPKAQTGSYNGLTQLSQKEFEKYGGKGSIYSVEANLDAGARKLRAEADQYFKQTGREPSSHDMYGIWQQGPAGYRALSNNPDQPAWRSIRRFYKDEATAREAITGNMPAADRARFGDEVSGRDFLNIWNQRMGEPVRARASSETQYAVDGTVPSLNEVNVHRSLTLPQPDETGEVNKDYIPGGPREIAPGTYTNKKDFATGGVLARVPDDLTAPDFSEPTSPPSETSVEAAPSSNQVSSAPDAPSGPLFGDIFADIKSSIPKIFPGKVGAFKNLASPEKLPQMADAGAALAQAAGPESAFPAPPPPPPRTPPGQTPPFANRRRGRRG